MNMDRIFIEENKNYQIDFTDTLWATDKLNDVFHNANTPLCDVDWVAETDEEILLVEYKNANIENAAEANSFDPKSDKKISNILKKYYDSIFYISAIGKLTQKKKIYVYILEYPNGDVITRKGIRNKLQPRLPFELQKNNNIKCSLIDDIKVLSINEWNKEYPNYPLTPIKE